MILEIVGGSTKPQYLENRFGRGYGLALRQNKEWLLGW